MNATDELAIELSKTKIVIIIVGSCAFVALGVWLFAMPPESIHHMTPVMGLPFNNPLFVHSVGIVAIVFFGGCAVYGIRKMFDKKPGLVFNSAGIIDNSSGVAAGFVPWNEILGAEIFQIMNQPCLVIQVKNPENFVARGNPLKSLAMKTNMKMCGSPITIGPNTLKMSFPELLTTFQRYHQAYAQRQAASI